MASVGRHGPADMPPGPCASLQTGDFISALVGSFHPVLTVAGLAAHPHLYPPTQRLLSTGAVVLEQALEAHDIRRAQRAQPDLLPR